MKVAKTVTIITILSMLMAVNANAWGKREQGILIGVGSALLLPSLFNHSGNRYYYDRGYYGGGYYAQPRVQYVQPQVTYIEPTTQSTSTVVVEPGLKHRQQKDHVYINKVNPKDTVVIEYSDGSKTIIKGR